MIHDVIDKLRALQNVLSQKFAIEAEIRDLPKSLATKTELLNRLKKTYIENNEKYEAIRKKITDLRLRLEEAERERERYERQMDLIKTQREYEALDKEIRDAGEREQELRKELQREEKGFQEMSHSLEREEAMIQQQEGELAEEQAKIKGETEAKQDQLRNLQTDEHELVPDLDPELLFKFERIIRSKEGEGIVSLRKGVCSGCQMILPNQFVNEVREGSEIKFCPYCSKIVFYMGDEDLPTPEDDAEGLVDLMGQLGDFDDDDFDDDSSIVTTDIDDSEDDEALDDADKNVLDEEPLDLNETDDDLDEDEEAELEEDEDDLEEDDLEEEDEEDEDADFDEVD